MILAQLITRDRIIPQLQANSQPAAIEELLDHLIHKQKIRPEQRQDYLHALHQREQQHSTGIGSSIAIPHAIVEGIDQTQAVFGRSSQGIDFQALDGAPVRFLLLFLVPKNQHNQHLTLLTSIIRTLSACPIRRELTKAETIRQIHTILTEDNPS